MPIQTSCPSCQRPLRVPDALIGKAVKCPGCATVWTLDAEPPAEPPREEPPAAPQEEKADDAVRESLPASESPGVPSEGIRETPAESSPAPPPPAPPTPPTPPLEDLEDEEDDPDYYDRLDDRRRERLFHNYREEAKSKVMGPAIGILVNAGIALLSALLNIGYGVFQVAMFASMPAPKGPGAPPPTGVMAVTGGIYGLMALFYLILGGVMLYGGLQMLKLKRYPLAMTSCILALLPCQGCCYVTGIPFGIWGLVVLLDPKIKSVFTGSTQSAGPAE